jgi:thiol-disulfide isomerase/thioredoxin
MKRIFIVFIGLLLLQSSSFAQPRVGEVSPDIALPDASGAVTKLSSLKGKVVLIDFWASWCGPCRVSNRSIQPVYKKFNDKGFEIFSVSLDNNKSMWQQAVKQDKMQWAQVIDIRAITGNQLMQVWNLNYIPFTCLVDRNGTIVAHNPSKKELEKLLEKLL